MRATPIGALLIRVAKSAESELSIPGTRGLGTEVPVLTANTPHPCERVSCALLPAHCGHKKASGYNEHKQATDRNSAPHSVPRRLAAAV
jgi:hypothetical protein